MEKIYKFFFQKKKKIHCIPKYMTKVRTFCPVSTSSTHRERSDSRRSPFVSADLYYLSKLNQTNREGAGIWIATQGQKEKKPSSFFHLKEWLWGGRKPSRNELRRDRSAAGSSRAELKHAKVVAFLPLLQVYLRTFEDASCFVHSICFFSFAVYLWQVCWTTHTKASTWFSAKCFQKKKGFWAESKR